MIGVLMAWLAMGALGLKARGPLASKTPLFNSKVLFEHSKLDRSKGISVLLNNKTSTLEIVAGIQEETAIAWASLADRLSTTGWIELHVDTTTRNIANDVKMYAAGLIEGLLTAERISQFYSNFYPMLASDGESKTAVQSLRRMFTLEMQYIESNSGLVPGGVGEEPADPFWKQSRYSFLQMWGIKDAYNLVAIEKGVRKIDMMDMMFINSHAELPELIEAYSPTAVASRFAFQMPEEAKQARLRKQKQEAELSADSTEEGDPDTEWKLRLAKKGHCSALVRLTDDYSDLLVGHTTWSDYSKMTRIYKYYNLDLPESGQAVKKMGFSSYPGCVSSTDDFYEMDNGLVVMDTSIEVLNPRVYDRVADFPENPKVPRFLNVMATNRITKSGPAWTANYALHNPGTGNSQWIVVDFKRFVRGQPPSLNLVRILETVPGLVHQADISPELLSKGYWAGYNRPFFQDIRKITGHADAEAKYGDLYSYEKSPRALLFKAKGSTVASLSDMRNVMMDNDGADAGHAIASRLDLDAAAGGIPNGAIDAKVVNVCLMKKLAAQAISGPSHESRPVFQWRSDPDETGYTRDLFRGWPHLGQPNAWNFSYVQMASDTLDGKFNPDANC
jgi:hypothetical protein